MKEWVRLRIWGLGSGASQNRVSSETLGICESNPCHELTRKKPLNKHSLLRDALVGFLVSPFPESPIPLN